MFFELIGTMLAGAVAAMVIWAVNRRLKGRLPGWLMPVSAGVVMIAATISSEYGWFSRTQSNMPAGLVVAATVEERAFYRPWTYAKPYVSRFVAVDKATSRTHPEQPGQRIVDLVFYGRWARTTKVPILFDCVAFAQANLIDGVEFGANGEILNPSWHQLPADDPLLLAACRDE